MGNFQELKVWQRAKELAVLLYKLTGQEAFSKDYGLRGQIRRAVVSIPSNIAKGDELGTDRQAIKFFYIAKGSITDRQAIKFFYIAKGSTAELLTQVIIANEIGYLTSQHFDHIKKECRAISGMLTRLIQARSEHTDKKD